MSHRNPWRCCLRCGRLGKSREMVRFAMQDIENRTGWGGILCRPCQEFMKDVTLRALAGWLSR